MQEGELLNKTDEHSKQINDIQFSKDMSMFVTASKDTTAKVRHTHTITAVTVLLYFGGPRLDLKYLNSGVFLNV